MASTYTDENGYERQSKEHTDLVHRNRIYHVYLENRNKYPLPFSAYEVHHKDFDKKNNKVNNLMILTPTDHDKLHEKERARVEKVREAERKKLEEEARKERIRQRIINEDREKREKEEEKKREKEREERRKREAEETKKNFIEVVFFILGWCILLVIPLLSALNIGNISTWEWIIGLIIMLVWAIARREQPKIRWVLRKGSFVFGWVLVVILGFSGFTYPFLMSASILLFIIMIIWAIRRDG